jgi:hypothetical protein
MFISWLSGESGGRVLADGAAFALVCAGPIVAAKSAIVAAARTFLIGSPRLVPDLESTMESGEKSTFDSSVDVMPGIRF